MADDLKIFISWSGPFAKAVALALRDWLGNLSDRIQPWMSEQDIDAGTKAMDEIASELNGTSFGIVVVTQDNQHAPWLNFEAGALSKQVNNQKARVVPLLMDMATPNDLTGPLVQYQAQIFSQKGIRKMVLAVAKAAGVEQPVIDTRLDKFWPDLEHRVNEIRIRNQRRTPVEPVREPREILDEALTRIKSIEGRLDAALRSTLNSTSAEEKSSRRAASPRDNVSSLQRVLAESMRDQLRAYDVSLEGMRGDAQNQKVFVDGDPDAISAAVEALSVKHPDIVFSYGPRDPSVIYAHLSSMLDLI